MPITMATDKPVPTLTPDFFAQPLVQNDSNWAGYIIASDLQNPQPNVTSVNASWIVPEITIPSVNDSFSAVWIGVGGYFDRSLIQVGSEQDSINGQAVYSLWYELLPAPAVTLDTMNISPGDKIVASINLVNPNLDLWSIYIADGNQVFQGNVNYASSQLSAEWILERPAVNRKIAVLANISSVTFSDCKAIIGSQTGTASSFPSVQSVMYQGILGTNGVTQLAYVSNLSNDGSSFTVNAYNPIPIPELPSWMMLPLLVGTFFAIVAIKKYHTRSKPS
jgi:hypothetical protein